MMNNSAFRNLIAENSKPSQNGAFKKPTGSATLGSRARSSIPMTPRSIPGQRHNARSEFARQVAETQSQSNDDVEPPLKKFKSNAAPKGSRLASGYVDRADLLRNGADDGRADVEDKEKRLKALEEMYKLQQIDLETFENLKAEIGIGGDISSTHLVRGLDWKLLNRVRRGEDVTKNPEDDLDHDQDHNVDLDAELDKAFEKEIAAESEGSTMSGKKSGYNGTDNSTTSQQTLSRDEILAQLKSSRSKPSTGVKVKQKAPEAVLNDKFKKIPTKPDGSKKEKFVETVDGRRREVLLITNTDGTIKRKTRWIDPEPSPEEIAERSTPVENERNERQERSEDKQTQSKIKKTKKHTQTVLGMEVPADIAAKEAARKAAEQAAAEEDDNDDIFQGVGADYDPLADIDSDAPDDDDDDGDNSINSQANQKDEIPTETPSKVDNVSNQTQPNKRINYFKTSTDQTDAEEEERGKNPVTKDPSILAALKRAADIRKREEQQQQQSNNDTQNNDNTPDMSEKSKAFLSRLRDQERQDAADLDMGFGGSRFDDDDDDEGGVGGTNDKKVKLLDFNHEDHGDDDGYDETKKGKSARKRGPKKRKGDKNNFADVMSAIERRK